MAENNEQMGMISFTERRSDCDNRFNPSNLRVLALDANIVSLRYLVALLHKCGYQVTSTTVAAEALNILRENRNEYDIVITDVVRDDMDGFKLLEIIGLEMDLPVIMVSAEDSTSSVIKGIRHGARDYLSKPVRIQEIKNIWQHVVRKTLLDSSDKSSITKEIILQPEQMSSKKHKIESYDEEEQINEQSNNNGSSGVKKPRLTWYPELHVRFLAAINIIEAHGERVHPKRIREVMNVEGLSRENIASHLQKYRNILKKQKIRMQDQEEELRIDLNRRGENSPMKNIGRGNISDDHARSSQKTSNSFVNTKQVFLKPTQQNVLQQNVPSPSMVFQQGMLNHMPAIPALNVLNMANNYIPAPEFKGLNYATACSTWKLSNDNIQMPSQCFGFEPGSSSMSPFLFPPAASLNTPTHQGMLGHSAAPVTSLLSSIIGLEQQDIASNANSHWRGTSSFTRQVNHGTHCSNKSENQVLIDIPKEEEAKLFMDDEISEMVKQFHNDGVPRL